MTMEGKELIKEAIDQAAGLREAALGAAKTQLIEMMTPKLKEAIEKKIKGNFRMSTKKEGVNRIRMGVQDNWPGESHTGFEESKDEGEASMDNMKDDKDMEMEAALAEFFPQIAEMGGEEDMHSEKDVDEAGIPTLGEEEVVEAKKKDDKEEVDESVEIDEAALSKLYQEALQTEVQVSKGFKDMSKAGELEEVDPAAGIADVKTKSPKPWNEEEPPAHQDYSVKEAKIRQFIAAGVKENKNLRARLGEAMKMIEDLGGKLHEVNLFNSKVLHANRLLTKVGRLTKEQKVQMMEQLDKAESIREVKLTYEAIMNSYTAAGALHESRARAPRADAQKVRAPGEAKAQVLRESADKDKVDPAVARFKTLAGLVNG